MSGRGGREGERLKGEATRETGREERHRQKIEGGG